MEEQQAIEEGISSDPIFQMLTGFWTSKACKPVKIPISAASITTLAAIMAPPTPATVPNEMFTPSPNLNTKSCM